MRPRPLPRRCLVPTAALLMLGLIAGCGGTPKAGPAAPTSMPPVDDDARSELAALAALAQDKAYAARYTLTDARAGRQHSVVAAIARDGTWRVDVGGGARGGSTDVSIVSTAAGVYQCTVSLGGDSVTPSCARVADPGKPVPKAYDPPVERLFRQWLKVFTDRQAALSVGAVQPLPGAQGTCFSIDSISASLRAPVDIGIYCFADDGVLTAARVGFGVLTMVSQADGPASVPLPGPDLGAPPMTMQSPPTPTLVPSGSVPPA